MVNQWTHEGGAAWLDAVLYDDGIPEVEPMDDADPLCSQAPTTDHERNVIGGNEPKP